MRKLLLLPALFSLYLMSSAQLTGGIKLNEQRIGTAGNMLTVDNYGCNQIDVNDSLNLVVFVHRNNADSAPGTNIGQYRMDVSTNGGASFRSNVGPFTSNPPDDGVDVNGRFPQAVIYNPAGNSNPDSAWLVYSGTWHDEAPGSSTGTWAGQLRGRGKISGDTSTFNTFADSINHGQATVATSMTQGAPGVFWSVNEDYLGTFATGSSQVTQGIIVEKGVWDVPTQNVIWTSSEIYQQFDSFTASNVTISVATAFNIAFDPTGQYGWIACLGDISTPVPGDSVFQPIFWKSTDYGQTWSQAIEIKLDSLPGVTDRLNTVTYDAGLLVPLVPGSPFEARLTVDYLGNPHLFTTVTNCGGYGYYADAGYWAYDITYSANPLACDSSWQGWSAVFVDSVLTLEGTYSSDNYTEDNRPLISRTADGTKLFFFWLDSDRNLDLAEGGGDANDAPNLFARGFDLLGLTSTPVFNLTANDSLFGPVSETNALGGIFPIGANYPVISPTARQVNGSYNIPVVLTEIDYVNEQQGVPGEGVNPAAFWYINNVTFSPGDFSNSLVASVELIGDAVDTIKLGGEFIDSGAIIIYNDTSCHSTGVLTLVIDSSGVNTDNTGTYYIYYLAENSEGIVFAATSRTVVVVGPPVADFTWNVLGDTGLDMEFIDLSTGLPTYWTWTFGDNATSTVENPTHTYAQYGTYTVCLSDSNDVGSSAQICHQVTVQYVAGIKKVDFGQNVTLYPNPTSAQVFVNLNGAVTSDFTVQVYDVLGQQVMGDMEQKAGTKTIQLNLGSLPNGTYMVKILSTEGTVVKQVVLTHSN